MNTSQFSKNKNKYAIFAETLADAEMELHAVHFTMNISRKWHDNPVACLRLDEREAELCRRVVELGSLCALYARRAA